MPPTLMSPQLTRRAGARHAVGCLGGVTGDVFGALIESGAAVTPIGAVLR